MQGNKAVLRIIQSMAIMCRMLTLRK